MLIQEPVKAAIWHCLNHYDYKDAVFLAERLCAEVETDESIFILATSYFRSQQIQQAFWLLKEKSRRSPHCRYLLAKCAYQLKYYAEAESALSSCNFGELKHFDEITKEFGEIACFAIYLIAQICIKTERTKIATDALHVALKLNPFLWHAFTELCLLDEQIDISNIFNVKNDNVFKTCQSNVNFMHTSIIFPNELNTTTSSTTATTTDINNEVIFINNQQQQQQLLKSNNKKGKIITRALYDSLLLKTPTPTTTTTGGIGAAAVATTTNMDMFQTPNNLNSSLNLLLGKTDNWDDTPLSIMQSTPPPQQQQQQQHDVAKLQAAHTLAHMDEFAGTNQQDAANISMNDTTTLLDTPFKRNFKYLQSSCPLTPSFGVLPFSPDMTAESPLIGANATTMTLNMNTPTPTPTTTTSIDLPKEQNKQRRQLNRDGIAYALALNSNNNNNNNSNNNNNAMRGGNNNNNSSTPALSQTTANRQSTNVTMMTTTTITAAPATTTTTPVQQQQAQFFTPTTFRTPVNVANNNNNNNNNNVATGNNNNNMNLPSTNNTTNTNNNNNNNNSAAVRRSSRLFGNNVGNSVKENSKTPPNIGGHSKFAAPRSPPRKTKPRIPKICLNNELIEEKFTTENKKIENQTTNKIDKRKLDKIAGKLTQQQQEQSEQKRANAVRAAIIASVTTQQQQQQQHKNLTTCIENNVNSINNINTAQTLTHEILKCKKQSAEGLMSLLRELGMGYKLLFTYNCKKALKHFETQIPNHHFNSCWLQSLIGVAHYELRQYEDAIKIFKAIREIEPYRLEYMEFYSSSLWHLQRDVEMSALAHDLINLNKLSPVTWCVAGNCFSLHKEHETAIKFFKRAVQIDPDFVYSYTLLGHELLLAEDLDKAMDYFRYAIMRDPRHYYAWFGMGTIYSKQEKYELAELHYMRALKINPQNSVILVHIGAMQYFMGKKDKALTTLNAAALLEPRDPLSRFHRASIYFSLGRHQEALDELEELKKLVPKESVVFYLIGKIHKQLGNADLALMHFSWATDLDPKGANNQIKDVFDSMAPQNCCSNIGDEIIEEAVSEGSEDSTQAHPELNYDSDVY